MNTFCSSNKPRDENFSNKWLNPRWWVACEDCGHVVHIKRLKMLPFEIYFRFKLHCMASRDSRDAHQNISRPWICVSFRSSLSTPSKPGLLEFGKDLRKLFDYLDFFVFHLDLSLSIFVLLWRLRFFVNGWISVVKKLLPQDNTRDTKEFVTTSNSQLTQETDKFIKKIVNTE